MFSIVIFIEDVSVVGEGSGVGEVNRSDFHFNDKVLRLSFYFDRGITYIW